MLISGSPCHSIPEGDLFGNELPTRALTSGACRHGTGDMRSPIGSQLVKCQACSALAARPPTGRCPHRALAAIEGILSVSSQHSAALPVFPQLTMRQTFDLDGKIPARVLTRRICCQRRMMPSSMSWALLPRERRGYGGSHEQYSIRQVPKGGRTSRDSPMEQTAYSLRVESTGTIAAAARVSSDSCVAHAPLPFFEHFVRRGPWPRN